jgi:hypothetical protein
VQFFGEIEGQFPGPLRFDDRFVLFENFPMLRV